MYDKHTLFSPSRYAIRHDHDLTVACINKRLLEFGIVNVPQQTHYHMPV